MKKLVIGITSHVDSGKTTLSEGMLYLSGSIGKLGRVDHKNAFLDTDALEKERGITIFSKQAVMSLKNTYITLLDTPGHVDFSSETERVLSVLDYAVLLVSGTDVLQGHTETLWKLLREYSVPAFIFVNKMDLLGANKERIMSELQKRLSFKCVDMSLAEKQRFEAMSLCSEELLESYLENGSLSKSEIARAIDENSCFPVFFGSALKLEGVKELLQAFEELTTEREYPKEFGAGVYKIARDDQGSRLTFMKLTGGSIRVKDLVKGCFKGEEWSEKIDQIRIYSGEKFKAVDCVEAGKICAVTGLSKTFAGEGLGVQNSAKPPLLTPVLTYQIILPNGCNLLQALKSFRILEEEDPQLHILWKESIKEIHVQVMGKIQLEVLKSKIAERFGLNVSFGRGSVVYKETIANSVEGVGHFEPLRHYAEVHLLLEPGERGSGVTFSSLCSTDVLDLSWQRLVMTHLAEKEHLGVLTGSPVTDIHITLINGKAHPKHTEGGDFRQATYRAVRHGLRRANSIILEPFYDFTIELPTETLGRAITDIQVMGGHTFSPKHMGEYAVLKGYAPVSKMYDYSSELAAFTKGRGRLSLVAGRYDVCASAQDVISEAGYDADSDLENTADSVFCAHGSGFIVPWFEVEKYMHLSGKTVKKQADEDDEKRASFTKTSGSRASSSFEDDAELRAIFERTYGAIKRKNFNERRQDVVYLEEEKEKEKEKENTQTIRDRLTEYLLVDGYNIIFAWDELKAIAKDNMDAARRALADILSNYQGYKKCNVILVFDAYRVKGNPGSAERYHNINIVFTKEAETADSYIEKTTYEIGKKYRVRVATSDSLEQVIILGHGAERVSAGIFYSEVMEANSEIRDIVQANSMKLRGKNLVGEALKRAQQKE